MSQGSSVPSASDITAALRVLEGLIRDRYPDASFEVFDGEDPEGVYLRATVDLDDPDEVMDLLVGALYEMQVERGLSVYVIPVQPLERAAQLRAAQPGSPVRFRLVAG